MEQAIGQYVLYRLLLDRVDPQRELYLAVYVTLGEDKVWIEYDGMEQGITQDLIDAGIPQERIVLAFLPHLQTVVAV